MPAKEISLLTLVLLIMATMVSCASKKELAGSPQLVYPLYILDEDKDVLEGWLTKNPEFRLALDSDCKCDEMIAQMNEWIEYHGYKDVKFHPYYVTGDFNGDGKRDFSVALLNLKKKTANYEIVIFNGPFNENKAKNPAYQLKDLNLEKEGLFYGPPRPKPWVLMFGDFKTENDFGFFPKGESYEYKEWPDE